MMNYKYITNITDLITVQAKQQPDAIAIYTDTASLTYQQLENLVWKSSTLLSERGIKSGEIVALTIQDELTLLIVLLGIARIGATAFMLSGNNPEKMYTEMLEKVKADILVTEEKNRYNKLPMILINDIRSTLLYTNINYNVRKEFPTEPYIIISGSGSTGKSKLMPISHDNDIKKVQLSSQWLPKTSENRIVSLSSLYFYSSIIMYLRAFNAGATIVFLPKTMNLIDACNKYNITIMFASISRIYHILDIAPNDAKNIMRTLKMLYITGSFIPTGLKEKILKIITKQLFIAYGTNECSTATLLTPSKMNSVDNSVGVPLEAVKVEIVDEKGNTLPVDTVGLVRVKSPAMISCYLNDEEATKKAFKNGWFYPGDYGKLTIDNQLVYMGRADYKIIMDGINIYPAEIEQVMMTHSAVIDAVALPIDSLTCQHIPICAVALKSTMNTTNKELNDYAYQYLGVKSPKIVFILESIPRNEQGKLIRSKLNHIISKKLSALEVGK